MDPLTIQLIGFAVQELIKNEPAIAKAFGNLMTKGDATPAEWNAAFALAQKPFDSFKAGE